MKYCKTFIILSLLLCISSCNSQNADFAISTDKTHIHFKTFGTGKPLLLINGGPGMNSNGFQSLAEKLGNTNLSIIYDQRGTGKSILNVLDSSTITMKLMIDDIESIRKKMKIEKWSILGHSFGGMVASYYTTLYPEHIDKIILSSSGGIDLDLLTYVQTEINSKLSKDDLDSVNYWTNKISEGDTSHYAKLERGRHLAPAYVIDKNFIPAIAERLTQGNPTVSQLIWTDLAKMNFNCENKLRSFNKPVLIIQGKHDIIKAETAEKAHKVLSNSKIVFLEHCIHYGWLDNEESYFQNINDFLSS